MSTYAVDIITQSPSQMCPQQRLLVILLILQKLCKGQDRFAVRQQRHSGFKHRDPFEKFATLPNSYPHIEAPLHPRYAYRGVGWMDTAKSSSVLGCSKAVTLRQTLKELPAQTYTSYKKCDELVWGIKPQTTSSLLYLSLRLSDAYCVLVMPSVQRIRLASITFEPLWRRSFR